MRKILLSLLAMVLAVTASARQDIDFSSQFSEGTNTIESDAWGWKSVHTYSMADLVNYDYLYIKYESDVNFNFLLQDENWKTCYQIQCNSADHEAYIKLEPGAYSQYTCVVIQPHAAGFVTVDAVYFCSESEFLYPDPQEMEAARENLLTMYTRYSKYTGTFTPGTEYGQYPEDLYNAFLNALEAALILDDASKNFGYDLSIYQVNALSHNIVDTYMALAAAQRLYQPANGYYRFICARQFYSETEEGDVTLYTKALYSKATGENGWKNVDREDPTFLWTLELQPDNTYLLRNPSNGLVFSTPENCTADIRVVAGRKRLNLPNDFLLVRHAVHRHELGNVADLLVKDNGTHIVAAFCQQAEEHPQSIKAQPVGVCAVAVDVAETAALVDNQHHVEAVRSFNRRLCQGRNRQNCQHQRQQKRQCRGQREFLLYVHGFAPLF